MNGNDVPAVLPAPARRFRAQLQHFAQQRRPMILKGHALHTPEEAVARVVAEGPVRGQVGVAQVEHKEARIVARRQKGLHRSEVVAIVAVPAESRGRHGDHPIRDVGQIEVESMLAISVCAWPCACACVPVCACVRARPRACARACVCASRPHAGCDHRRLFCDTKDRSLPFTLTSKRRALRRFTSTRNSLSPACASERASVCIHLHTCANICTSALTSTGKRWRPIAIRDATRTEVVAVFPPDSSSVSLDDTPLPACAHA